MKLAIAMLFFVLISLSGLNAQEDAPKSLEAAQAIVAGLKPQKGQIVLGDKLATLNVPDSFNYYGPQDAETILTRLWGNPPRKYLGLLMPSDLSPISRNGWGVIIQFEESGYVTDNDAEKIDYAKMLQEAQGAEADFNAERKKKGYPSIHLVGWASTPHYDKATHKLYWAKEMQFQGEKENTLNYNIRVLGRHGVLVLNVVSGMSRFAAVDKQVPEILAMVDFKDGNRYADFNPNVDKVAGYGIAALVAGGVLAKTGMLKGLWIAILALKKFIIVGAIAAWAAIKKFLGFESKRPTPLEQATGTDPNPKV